MRLEKMVRDAIRTGALEKYGFDSLVTPLLDDKIEISVRVGETTARMIVQGTRDECEEVTQALQLAVEEICKKLGVALEFAHQRPTDATH
jgi:hypothetical protein